MVLAIVQARMGSSRLPGKVMKKVLGKPMVGYVLERVLSSKAVDKVVLATSTNPENEEMCEYVKNIGIDVFRGSEDDVLDRFYQASLIYKPDTIVRITADCPLILPELINKACDEFFKKKPDYLGYLLPYPEGLADIAVLSFSALATAWREAQKPSEREHVVTFLINRPDRFDVIRLPVDSSVNHLRFTVDESRDFIVVKDIIERLYEKSFKKFGLKEIEDFSCKYPEIMKINAYIQRNEGYLKSLLKDKKKEIG